MRKARLIFASVMLVFALLGQSQPASAASAAHFAVKLNDTTIPWIFPPPEGVNNSICPAVPEGVNINPDDNRSDRLKTAAQVEMPDGTTRMTVADKISGTASDNSGGTYTFLYLNAATLDFDGTTVTVLMHDFFTLNGTNASFTVAFSWRWKYLAENLELVEVKDENGNTIDIVIDPFFFVTGDGVTEGPDVVPGSWEQIRTLGDPAHCDPL